MSIPQNKVGIIIQDLLQADYDQLKTIVSIGSQQLKERRNQKVSSLKASLEIGQKVLVKGNKTNGEIGTIIEIRNTRATVEIDGVHWNCPISILDQENVNGE